MSSVIVLPETKVCARCHKSKPLTDFYKRSKSKDGYGIYCKPCHLLSNSLYRFKNREKINEYSRWYHKHYRHTSPKGFLCSLYTHMKNRVTGSDKTQKKFYLGLPILDRQEFYTWALKDREFNRLFFGWKRTGYSRRSCPSINRINSSLGYVAGNMNWLTQKANSALGGKTKRKKKTNIVPLRTRYLKAG
jgi:hypothetical protein